MIAAGGSPLSQLFIGKEPIIVQKEFFAPAAALAAWTMIMLVWMFIVTGKAFRMAGLDTSNSKPGSRGQDLAGTLPDRALWPSHNYTHLVEQPTIFYPIVIIMGIYGGSKLDLYCAWMYVAIRVAHSCWQATINTISFRFALFALSSFILLYMTMRVLIATFT